MSTTPDLRLRRDRQPRIIGNVIALAVFGLIGATVLARGLMPGITPHVPQDGIDSVNPTPACTRTVLPNTC